MTLVVKIDGQSVPPDKASVSVFDRGFLYGDSVFETIRTYAGQPFALAEHMERLERSAELVYIPLPTSRQVLADEVRAALHEANNPESYVRVMITRGQGELGLDPGLADVPRRVIIVDELQRPPDSAYRDGVGVVTYRTQRPADATSAQGAKIGNYLVAVLGVRTARAAGAVEALIVGAEDRVVEGASSNVFIVRGGRLVTPAVDVGILPGITRDRVLKVARELQLPVEFECPTVAELLAADEVFISSSIREILPVVRVDDRAIGSGRPGGVTQRLHAGFLQKVRGELGLDSPPS